MKGLFEYSLLGIRCGVKYLIGCLLWLAAISVHGDSPIAAVNNLDAPFDLNPYVETIEDPLHQYTLEGIQAGKYDHLWQRNTRPYFVGRNAKSKYWFRFALNWQGQHERASILYIASHPLLSHIAFSLPTQEEGVTRLVETGQLDSDNPHEVAGHQFAVKLPLRSNVSYRIFGWTSNAEMSTPLMLPFYLVGEAEFNPIQNRIAAILIAFYAAMGALWLYNLCLFFTLRETVYGLYIIFLACAVLASSAIDGTLCRFLTPGTLISSIGIFVAIAYLSFVAKALNSAVLWPWFKIPYRLFLILGCLTLTYNCLTSDLGLASTIAQIYAIIPVPFSLMMIVVAMRNRHPTAGYLLIAECTILFGGTVFMLMLHGILPISFFTVWGLHWAYLGEALLLSLALAARTRVAQQDAIEHLQQYENLYESSVQGLFQFNLLNNSLKCNDAFAKLFGYAGAHELPLYNTPLEQFNKSVQAELPQMLAKTGYVADYEAQVLSPKLNSPIWVSVNMQLIKDQNGKAIRTDGSMVDISERKLKEQVEQELVKSNKLALKNLSRSDELKKEFLATMSHELRTPMNGIAGYLELLKAMECSGDVLNVANSIDHCSSDMLRLIDRILDFTQLLAGSLNTEFTVLDFNLMLAELETSYRQRCKDQALTFTFTKEDNVPAKAWGDRKKLFVIINDLLDNAVKYTRTGGITVVIKALPTKSDSGNTHDNPHSILVSVRDTGIGIAMADRPKIFKAFSQLDGAFNRKQGGLGLGLAMCHEYIKLMNGTLTLLSEPGKGSKFDFIVDLKIVPNLAPPIATVQKNPELGTVTKSANANILIVEDNPTNQLVLNGNLKKLGHHTSIAENGIRALEILQTAEFDLILMYCQMPEMDGFEATHAIRQGNRQKDIPIIAVTANVMEGDQQRCLDAGMNDYMKKPIKKELLMEKINQWYKV